ncbi:UvrD-helicase domain-containing protein, partial [Candidatus Uhrbacteria bacterium]|nr:UvrD-helicase domain-containing protein [Candidatus Uhrbacteria bacterium]
MIDYTKELNDEQRAVVAGGDGPCLVLAGAGSGKTRTIVYRVAYLIERGVSPKNILLLTFTNKAAQEMMRRVETLLGSSVKGLWGGTFHSLAHRILRRLAAAAGYGENFTILDQDDSRDLIKACLKDLDLDIKARRFPSPAVLQAIISFSRNAAWPLPEAISVKHQTFCSLEKEIEKIAAFYSEKKLAINAMDFDDLLIVLLELLQKNQAMARRW